MQRRSILSLALAAPALVRGAQAQAGRVLRVVAPWEIGGLDPLELSYRIAGMRWAD